MPPLSPLVDESQSINDNWFNRFILLLMIELASLFMKRKEHIFFFTPWFCIKYGRFRHLPEASTMRFIASQTTIPVPRVYCAFRHGDSTYILMEKIKGRKLAHGWTTRTVASKRTILQQLREMVDSMRRIPAPSHAIANSEGGALWDCRMPGSPTFGPFDDIDGFHRYLRGGFETLDKLTEEVKHNLPTDVKRLIGLHHRSWADPVFTHGDLSSLNIMVEGEKISGIVDWETSGWYPYYWEYTTACYVNFRNEFWRDEIDKFLTPHPEELSMEELRKTYFGDT